MADSPDYKHWIEIAEGDLAAARILGAQDPVRLGLHALFHCQQSAEKYLKACLRFRQVDFPKVHDFEKPLRICEGMRPEFRTLGPTTARLQPFAVQARYSLRTAEAATVRQALEDADYVRDFCRRFVGLADDGGQEQPGNAAEPPNADSGTSQPPDNGQGAKLS